MSRIVPGWLSDEGFDTETLLDVTVNLVPMGILAFFVGASLLFAFVFRPFPYDPFATVLSHGLTILPFVFLAVVTYASAKVLSGGDDTSYGTTPSDPVDAGGDPPGAVERAVAANAGDAPDVGTGEASGVDERGRADGDGAGGDTPGSDDTADDDDAR